MKSTSMQRPTGLPTTAASSTQTEDGRVVSVIFEDLKADSSIRDSAPSVESKVMNFAIPLAEGSQKFVRVHARGFRAVAGLHSWALALVWINGQRMRIPSNQASLSESWYAAALVNVQGKTELRVSVTLLAQRDMSEQSSAAQCALDSLDFEAIDGKDKRL